MEARDTRPTTNRIRQVRQERGMTLQELGEKAGMHYTTVAKLERSQRGLKLTYLLNIANALGVPARDLLESEPEIMPMRMVPLIDEAAAPSWPVAIHDPVGYAPSPAGGVDAFALLPDTGSMDKVVGPGAYIVVDPDDRELRDDKVYAMKNGENRTVFKRFRANPLQFEPCSSDLSDQVIPLGSEPLTTIGRVVWQGSEM